jgi:hypothetical protein
MLRILESIKEESECVNNLKSKENLETVLMIASLAHMSNLYRRAAEKLVDEINGQAEKHL